ncbi:HAMP domain-containing sensor histidine kinase [Uliginosibacterium sp. H1]|uniref:HAMP domain-containing sensor histidine kinase n=1 Tax=Uliginosibacterium sp. H1 TaxID=3114757 RepID=UPI002E16F058|nr:ATP-binding protein [Uliginosibacterium sp. H1]
MDRLFWKIFLSFWLSLLLGSAVVAAGVYLYNQSRADEQREQQGRVMLRGEFSLRMYALLAEQGGVAALRQAEAGRKDWELPAPMVVDAQGRELLGRELPAGLVERIRSDHADLPFPARSVKDPQGQELLMFVPPLESPRVRRTPRNPYVPYLPWFQFAAALAASLIVSALLARHLSRPIEHLRDAFDTVAQGGLGARVGASMGRRRDELAQLGRDFDHMAGQLQKLVGSQERLLHDVSHELRSPLARMQVAVGLARQQPDKLDTALSRIEREADRLNELVGEVLTLSRLESTAQGGALAERQDFVDIAELAATVVEDARFEGADTQREIRFDDGNIGELVMPARGELLHRALDNVVRNALQHTPERSVVEVVLRQDRSGGRVLIDVSDQGPGVGESELEQIFEPFVRGHGEGKGYGLGLAIARRAIEAHGGTIVARNRRDGGLRVSIALPVPAAEVPPT